MSLKLEFVERAASGGAKVAGLCREYGISRETGHKWLKRFRERGYEGLEEQTRRPRHTPMALAQELVMAVLEAREAHPSWGPKKLYVLVEKKHGAATPSRASIGRILKQFGKVRRRRARLPVSVVERAPAVEAKAPNDVWTVDFKGWWRSLDGGRCEPLTVRDGFSRYVLAAKVMSSSAIEGVRTEFARLFRKHGLPAGIQCDNGIPFISVQGRGGLTQLSAWWVSLGIRVVRSRPGCPQDNGAHERMHRDIAAEIQVVPQASIAVEQRRLDRWRQEFNHVRPHEALGGKTPAELYRPSARRSLRPVRFSYPADWLVRRVYGTPGKISINAATCSVGRALVGHVIALQPLGGLRYRGWFRDLDLGEFKVDPSSQDIAAAAVRMLRKEK